MSSTHATYEINCSLNDGTWSFTGDISDDVISVPEGQTNPSANSQHIHLNRDTSQQNDWAFRGIVFVNGDGDHVFAFSKSGHYLPAPFDFLRIANLTSSLIDIHDKSTSQEVVGFQFIYYDKSTGRFSFSRDPQIRNVQSTGG